MGALPLLIALAAVGGHVTFLGTIVTATADTTALAASAPSALHAARVGRFNGPPRIVRIQRAHRNAPTEVVITYL